MRTRRLLAGVLSGGLVFCASAQIAQARGTGPLSVEDRSFSRTAGSTDRAAAAPVANTDGMIMLMQQQTQLEEQIQFLQGQVEELRHQMERMRAAERERYLDLDARINSLTAGNPAGGAPLLPTQGGEDGNAVDPEADRAAYNAARDFLGQRDFVAAGDAFRTYLSDFPGGEYRGYAHFWLGRVYSTQQEPDYAKARQHFQTVLEEHPEHVQAAPSLYSLAVLQARAGDVADARKNLQQLLSDYPDSDETEQAQRLLDQLKGSD